MNKVLKKGLILCSLLLAPAALAEYVSDQLEITLRSGPTNQHRITQMLESGTRLQVMERQAGWARVRTAQGREGWVLERYLMSQPSARDRLQRAQARLDELLQDDQSLRSRLLAQQERTAELEAQVSTLQGENSALSDRLETASRGLTLADENQELQKRIVDLQREIQGLVNETERLTDRSRQDWFLVGAGVLFGGMILGLILPRLRWKKRSSWSSGL
ncbi:TIGR04211 family SH3 domain-containing protein [Alkalilimnicola sp. S0819]|uniref:TIGR04211 family SH3 domain-containing protein n=1 Tax=Alkalilimnicola sp. S0819 TaxID=2613922 RepID=UPI00128C63AE|nr:TIGR04211 family SH3 domain-containing protein [Alkalilimnicola sp. S0819]